MVTVARTLRSEVLIVKVRLTKKLAPRVDGIDLSDCAVGDVLDLPDPEAELLVAERWAEHYHDLAPVVASPTRSSGRLRAMRATFQQAQRAHAERRRAEDRIREELRDERARVIRVVNG